MMNLNEIRDNPGATKPRKRIGRGIGSGTGKTSGKGHKGEKARAGNNSNVGFEGGQMPLHRRLPKRGFKNPFRLTYVVVNLGRVQKAIAAGRIDAGQPIDAASLRGAGLFRRTYAGVRLLGEGELSTPATFHVAGASKSAIEKVEKLGGSVVIVAGKAPAGAPATAPESGEPTATNPTES